MCAEIQTLTGRIDRDELDVPLMYEHILLVNREIAPDYLGFVDEVATMRAKLHGQRQRGADILTDLTILGLGRDIELIRRCAGTSQLNVVVVTGFYGTDDLPSFFKTRHDSPRDLFTPGPLLVPSSKSIEE